MLTLYPAVAIVTLALIFPLLLRCGWIAPRHELTPLGGVAFAFVGCGSVMGDQNSQVGYALMGFGVGLALLDIWRARPTGRLH